MHGSTLVLYYCLGQLIFDAESEKSVSEDSVSTSVHTIPEVVDEKVMVSEVITRAALGKDEEYNLAEKFMDEDVGFRAVNKSSIPISVSGNPKAFMPIAVQKVLMLVCVAETPLFLHCTNSLRYHKVPAIYRGESEVATYSASTRSASTTDTPKAFPFEQNNSPKVSHVSL
ncbi:hypothetical protein LOAG_02352 [Loa loa]|uniref:Ty3-gypsy retrotransposon protein n=1 Tax=Loa loa TaxID=7209 RepID=A0A1I7VW59_LOALO|nr:hypothetical protein LOAG_02352 [Loa loa]EFO26135.1 hypothetical protein LOAG_02352 [Loa loa]